MKKQDYPLLLSHRSLIFITLLVVFLAEIAVMVLLLNEEPRHAILDASLLTILAAPFLAFLITKNMQAQNAIQKAHRRLSVLYTIDRKASQSLNLNEILNAALDATLNGLKIEAGGIFILEPDGETMTLRTHRGFSEEFVNDVRQIKLDEGVSGKAAADKKPVVLDVSEYPTERLAPFIIREGLKTLASTPIITGGKVIGVLNLGTRRSYAFPPEEIELLTSVGLQLGIVMQNARLYEKVQQELVERKRMEEELRRAKDVLETRVLERTAELTKANEALQSEIDERMRMEHELHVIVSQLTVLLESLPIGIIFEDDARRIAISNSAFCRMMGYSALPHELIGADCRKAAEKDRVFYSEPEKFVQRIEELIRERRIVANEELSLADGRTFERDYIPIFIGKEPYRHLWLYRDITERKRMEEELHRAKDELETRVLERTANLVKVNEVLQAEITVRKHAEEALKESEERFRYVVETSINAVIVADIDGVIISWNKRAEKIFLYAEEEILGKPLTILIPERYRNAHLAGLKHLISTGEYTVIGKIVERYGLRKDGAEFPMEISLGTWKTEKGIFFSGIIRDITERKKAEEMQRKLSSAVEHTADIVIITKKDGTIEYVNPAFEKITGYTLEEAVGKTPKILKSGKHDKKFYENLWGTILSGEVFYGVLINKKNNGELYYAEKTITPIKDEHGTITHFVSTDKDLTERKKAEETRLENLRLEAADRAKSEFLANMSHELRTPLNASIGFSELLTQGMAGELSEKQKHFMDNILTSSQFLLTLINDILDLSKIEAGKIELVPEKMSVPVTIKETLSLIKERASKRNVLLKTEFDPELEFIEADKQRFKQILFNLLSNAVKFSKEEGGTVTITAKKEGDMARISVSDTGIGIKEENIGRLFHKFEQLESGISQKYGGTGLGLAITKQLVELHGGKIQAESKYGVGSTFTFMLPLKAKNEENK